MSNILQWNICGLQANREELQLLLSSLNCDIISLQETKIKSGDINFNRYATFQKPANDVNGVSHGGVALLVRNSIPHISKAGDFL